jgi:hypothetical protein
MQYLIGLIGLLFGGLFFYRTKAKSAGALLENEQSKREINTESEKIAKANGLLDAEQQTRSNKQEATDDKLAKETTNAELVDFFNSLNKHKR